MGAQGLWYVLTRRKNLDIAANTDTQLSRCLGTKELTALGVGGTLGVGVYVLTGHVAKELAGPSVVLSFLLAAVASIFAGLCYAEFGARVPRAGSAYIYSYVCVGEFIAFIIGWNLILEYVIGAASVSRGISLYLDTLLNNTLKESFKQIVPIDILDASEYFDLLAFGLAFVIGVALAFGLKRSSFVINLFTLINICIVIFVIICGAVFADTANWNILPNQIPEGINGGEGGFFPYGFAGTLKGAATCFFGFIGFDCIATTGEEVKNPKKAIPLSIIFSLTIIFFSYFGVSTILTLMVPYYLQDSDAPIPNAFHVVGLDWAKWIVAIGGIFGLIASLFGAMFPLPRILYAMASDGLIFRFFGIISKNHRTPVIGTILASLLTGTMAGIFELSHLVSMMSIGTLMAYTVVAACIVLLRYKYESRSVNNSVETCALLLAEDSEESDVSSNENWAMKYKFPKMSPIANKTYEDDIKMTDTMIGSVDNLDSTNLIRKQTNHSAGDVMRQLFNCDRNKKPTRLSSIIVGTLIALYCLFCLSCALCISNLWEELNNGVVYAIVLTSIFGALMLLSLFCIAIQPKSKTSLSFQVPLVPLIPFISIFINIYLMLMLDAITWIRFGIWMAIGIPVYIISICAYKQGKNYVTYAQKSSVNGSLNCGIDNVIECKERESPERETKIALSVTENTFGGSNMNEDEKFVFSDEKLAARSLTDSVLVKNSYDKNIAENDFPIDSYGEEIDMLDQILKDAEADSAASFFEFVDTEDVLLPEEKSLEISQETKSNLNQSDSDIIGIQLNEPSNLTTSQSVIVIVHREDEHLVSSGEENLSDRDKIEANDEKTEEISNSVFDNTEVKEDQPINDNIQPINSGDQSVESNINDTNEKVFIPLPPPIPSPPPVRKEESSSTAKYIKYKAPTIEINRKREKNIIANERKRSLDETKSDLPRNEFIEKLNVLFESHAKNPDLTKQRTLQRGLSVDATKASENNSPLDSHKSEPDLVTALKREALQITIIPSKEIDESHASTVNNEKQENNSKNKLHPTDGTNITDDNVSPSPADIRKKLEAIFSKSPTTQRVKMNVKNDSIENSESQASSEISTEDAIKPKSKENYTNTMKIQRARFEDVLKSIQETQTKRQSVGSDKLVAPKLRHSITKSDISNTNIDDSVR